MNTVQPIKSEEKLQEIQAGLESDQSAHGRRMFLLFMCGIYTGLRVSDLVRLRAGNVRGSEIILREQKTGKTQTIPLAVTLQRVLADRTAALGDEDYLFPSRSRMADGRVKPISTRSAYNDMQAIARRYGLKGYIGCHTMRKTFGYWHYQKCHDLELLRGWFNHATQEVTRRYICVDVEEKRRSIQGFSLGYEPCTSARPMRAQAIPVETAKRERARRAKGKAGRQAEKEGAAQA